MEKSKKIIVALVVFIILIAISLVYIFWSKLFIKKESIKRELRYIKLFENNKYGIISPNGKVIIQPKYEDLEIIDNSSNVFAINSKKENEIKYINDKEEEILKDLKVSLIKNNSMDKKYMPSLVYVQNNKKGLLSIANGAIKKQTKPIYDEIESTNHSDKLYLVTKKGKKGIIDECGNKIIDTKYEYIEAASILENTENQNEEVLGYIFAKKIKGSTKYGFLNNFGRMILDAKFDSIEIKKNSTKNNDLVLIVSKADKYGVYNNKREIIKVKYQKIVPINNAYIVEKDSKFGIISDKGKDIISPRFEKYRIPSLEDEYIENIDYVVFEDEDKEYLFDKNGKQILSGNSKIIDVVNDGKALILENLEGERFVKTKDKELKNSYINIYPLFNYNYCVYKDNLQGVVNIDNKVIIPFDNQMIFRNLEFGLVFVEKNKKTTIYNKKMEKIGEFSKYNISTILNKENGVTKKYVQIISENEIIILDEHQKQVDKFESDEYILKKGKNSKWKIEAKSKNFKNTDYIYDYISEFNKFGYARAIKDGKTISLFKDGSEVFKTAEKIEPTINFLGKYFYLEVNSKIVYAKKDMLI